MFGMDVLKASGGREKFSRDKLCRSLQLAGAPENVVQKVCGLVEKDLQVGASTAQIEKKAAQYLSKEDILLAAHYKLRSAIMELGPAGFFFEEYIAALLREYGYETKLNQTLQGKCLAHEIDILAEKEQKHDFIEAKYHNQRGVKTDVHVAMYTYARLLDLKAAHEQFEEKTHGAWVVTNTKFTQSAITYASCMGLKMTGWSYPKGESLEQLIVQKALYPITVLPSANHFIREQFAKEKLMFVRDVLGYSPETLASKFNIHLKTAKKLISESYKLV